MESSEMNSCKPSFLSYRGRARRRTWWCATLVIGLIAAVAMFIAVWPLLCVIANGGMDDLEAVLSAHGFGLLLASAIGIVAFFLLLPVNVRRLHDRNMSGWWLLAFWIGNAIPCVGGFRRRSKGGGDVARLDRDPGAQGAAGRPLARSRVA